MASDPTCVILLTWTPHRGELHLHIESWADDGDRWWLDKEHYGAVHEPLELLHLLKVHLEQGDFTWS